MTSLIQILSYEKKPENVVSCKIDLINFQFFNTFHSAIFEI
jgi:hypothetical protein